MLTSRRFTSRFSLDPERSLDAASTIPTKPKQFKERMESQKERSSSQATRQRNITCPQCENNLVSTSIQKREYVYGSDESAVRLPVENPVHSCNQCDFQFTDWEAEEIEHNALCQHFGVLTPKEIIQLRRRHKMSRAAFSQLTGLGEASLSRWEKGINIQNLAHDRYLRLLDYPAILNRLKRTVSMVESGEDELSVNIVPFPHLPNRTELEMKQRQFMLRSSL